MTVTIEVPEELVMEAQGRGVAVEELVKERLRRPAVRLHEEVAANFNWARAAEAAERIRENSLLSTLGPDVTIKQLIEEGRRY